MVKPAFNEIELAFLELSKNRRISNEDVIALKRLWSFYFLEKATVAADTVWKKKKVTNKIIKKLLIENNS